MGTYLHPPHVCGHQRAASPAWEDSHPPRHALGLTTRFRGCSANHWPAGGPRWAAPSSATNALVARRPLGTETDHDTEEPELNRPSSSRGRQPSWDAAEELRE
jgi:hypothetical protein